MPEPEANTPSPEAEAITPSPEAEAITPPDELELLAVAHEAAAAGAAELRPRFGSQARGVRTKSTPTDLVSEADLAAEKAIHEVLQRRRPGDAILAEEGGATESSAPGPARLRWVVDPLDGSVNFLFGIPAFAVSVACESSSGAIVGVVLDPTREECFAATRSAPTTLNGQPIEAPDRHELGKALVATGFGYDSRVRERQAAVVARVIPRVRDIRRGGAAALDLAWCACGRYDAYYERGVQHWDVAAGALIAEQAGLQVRQLPPTEHDAAGIAVASEGLIDRLVELVLGEQG